jgi:hypothetical protein
MQVLTIAVGLAVLCRPSLVLSYYHVSIQCGIQKHLIIMALRCRKKQELQILYVASKIPIKNYLFIINILYMMYGRETEC